MVSAAMSDFSYLSASEFSKGSFLWGRIPIFQFEEIARNAAITQYLYPFWYTFLMVHLVYILCLTIRFFIQSMEDTLKDAETEGVMNSVMEALEEAFGAQIR